MTAARYIATERGVRLGADIQEKLSRAIRETPGKVLEALAGLSDSDRKTLGMVTRQALAKLSV
jgi:hypothetical protein